MGILDRFREAGGNAKSAWNSSRGSNANVKERLSGVWNSPRISNIPGSGKVVGTAGLMGGLALGAMRKGKEHNANLILILSFILFLFDRTIGYRGFYITGVGSFFEILKLFTSLLYVVGVWALFYFFMSKDRSPKALVTFVVAMIVVVITIALAFKLDKLSIMHVAFILLLWFTFIKNRDDAPTANLTLIGLLIVDLYLYSIVAGIAPQFAQYVSGFPILFFLTIGYVYQETNSKLAWVLIFSVVAWYFITAGPALAEKLNTAGIEGVETKIPSIKELVSNFKKKNIDEPIKKFGEGVSSWLSSQISYALSGKVEQNQREPLGVYLENVQSADPRYYEDEDVTIWGTVKARTLDDPINIKVGCFVKPDIDRVYADKVDPDKKFSVFTSEERDFACKFTKEQIKAGVLKTSANTINAFADFNFETLAELKVYFMNQERIRAMTRENQDPLDEFEIKDKKPVAIYTNGPAELLMGTTTPLIGVSDSYIVFPTADFSLKNRDGWQGRINNLKELVLLLPANIDLDAANGCNKKFYSYDAANCKSSCKTFVFNECDDACSKGKGNCNSECNEVNTKCESVCNSLFDEGGQKYNGYALDLNDARVRDEMKDFDKFKLFRCRFEPKSSILGDTPITTKFFRIKARYDYTVESPVTVIIDKVPEELKVAATGGKTTAPTTPAAPGFLGYDTLGRKVYSNDLVGPLEQGAVRQSEATGAITPTPPDR